MRIIIKQENQIMEPILLTLLKENFDRSKALLSLSFQIAHMVGRRIREVTLFLDLISPDAIPSTKFFAIKPGHTQLNPRNSKIMNHRG